jgi:helicase
LRDRATGVHIEAVDGKVRGTGPAGSVLAVWGGSAFAITAIKRGYAIAEAPSAAVGEPGAAVFTWRGDYQANGWLAAYSQLSG